MRPGLESTHRHTHGWVIVGMAWLVVAMMGCGAQTDTRQLTIPIKLTGHWQAVPNLSKELTVPIIAPSDPRVAYELAAPSDNGLAHGMQRTDDGGATWTPLPTPSLPGPLMEATIRISPVDAHNVFLQLDFGVQMTGDGIPTLNCPGPLAHIAPATQGNLLLSPLSNYGDCPALFYSTDGGDHWASAQVPVPSILAYANASWPMMDMDVLRAQGNRLYAAMQLEPNGTSPIGTRLMVSADKGATWQLADASLFTQAPAICNLAAAPQGTTLFALTADSSCYDSTQTDRTVWRSDDGGAQWTQTGTLPDYVQQMFAAGGNGSQPLLYTTSLDQSGTPALSGVRASADGGRTWQTAPTAGLPANTTLYQIVGVLPDGSLVAAMWPVATGPAGTTPGVTPTYTGQRATYPYAFSVWKPGNTSWHQLSANAPTTGQPGYMLVAPGSGTTSTSIWVVTINGDFFGGSGAAYSTNEYVLG